jgi:hypothetical protein
MEANHEIEKMLISNGRAMPQLRWLVGSFSMLRSRFAPRVVHVELMVAEVALGQISLRFLQFFTVIIIPSLFHIHSCITWGLGNGPISGSSSTGT